MATFDATVGGASATSYDSVAEADAILAVTPGADAWADLDEATKELRLMQMTALIDSEPYASVKASATQRLKFPRAAAKDDEGAVLASDIIPDGVQRATALGAFLLEIDPGSLSVGAGSSSSDEAALSSLKVASVELKFASTSTTTTSIAPAGTVPIPGARFPELIRRELAPFFRVVRAAIVSSIPVLRSA